MHNRQLLEESEQLIFRSAVSISETDMLIERSRRLLFNKDNEKLPAATNEVVAVGHAGALPTEYVLPMSQWKRNRWIPGNQILAAEPARILIIDDDTVLLTALADTLKIRLERLVIETATNGTDGLARAEQSRYNIILFDVSMPEINGLSLLPRLKKASPDSVIIMMTGHGDESTRRTALGLGAVELIRKPFDRPALVRTLKQVLQA